MLKIISTKPATLFCLVAVILFAGVSSADALDEVIVSYAGPTVTFLPASQRDGSATVAFILDRRFDAARQLPMLSVRTGMLLLEWLFAVNVLLGVVALRARSAVPGSE